MKEDSGSNTGFVRKYPVRLKSQGLVYSGATLDIYAQLIDDENGVTLAAASSKDKEVLAQKVNKSEKGKLVGQAIAKKAIALGLTTCVFDRGGYLYHGRVKAVAEGAREGGLKF